MFLCVSQDITWRIILLPMLDLALLRGLCQNRLCRDARSVRPLRRALKHKALTFGRTNRFPFRHNLFSLVKGSQPRH